MLEASKEESLVLFATEFSNPPHDWIFSGTQLNMLGNPFKSSLFNMWTSKVELGCLTPIEWMVWDLRCVLSTLHMPELAIGQSAGTA